MKSYNIITIVALFGAAVSAEITGIGCYKSANGLKLSGTLQFNSRGACGEECAGSIAFGTSGSKCFCGNEIPADSDKVDDSKCSTFCPGWKEDNCGGPNLFYIWDQGTSSDIPKAEASEPSSSAGSPSSATSTSAPSVVTVVAGKTVTATPSAATSSVSSQKSSGGPSTAGIAAGVVVGVVAILALAGGGFMFIRNRKRRAIEEEHRRNAAVNTFIGAGKSPTSSGSGSFNDTRLDPVMAQRRMSDGSIADNQDYSRRILKVTNA